MTKTEIKEFKGFVREVLIKKYHLSELEAQRAVRNSYLSTALARDCDYVEHDTVEEWADYVYDEFYDTHLMQL